MVTDVCGKGYIHTVQGCIDPGRLGYCQCHEHIFIARGKPCEITPSLCIDDYGMSLKELGLYKDSGGLSIVDAQPVGCGRMADLLFKASVQSGVNIIASTGFHKVIFYDEDHWIYKKDEDYLSSLFIEEIEAGMYLDGDLGLPSQKIQASAGIIKTAVDSYGIKGVYEKLFSAAAEACLNTGVPILCHLEKGCSALDIVEFLVKRGVDPHSIILCHLDRTQYELAYHREVAKTGVFLEYDTIGRFKYHSDEQEIELISYMIDNGLSGHILLGLDTTRERLQCYGGNIGLNYIKEVFTGSLLNAGITQRMIDILTVENPKNALMIL